MSTLIIQTSQTAQLGLHENEAGYPAAKSRMTQAYGLDGATPLVYLFPYAPVKVAYDSIGSEYEQIERPGNYSLVNQKAPNLLRVSFDFRVASRPTNGLADITNDLQILKQIALDNAPVKFTGLGGYLTGWRNSSAAKFRITSLNVEIQTVGPNQEPWQANCSIELVEDRNPNFTYIAFSPIVYPDPSAEVATFTSGSGSGGRNSNDRSSDTNIPLPPLSSIIVRDAPPYRSGQPASSSGGGGAGFSVR